MADQYYTDSRGNRIKFSSIPGEDPILTSQKLRYNNPKERDHYMKRVRSFGEAKILNGLAEPLTVFPTNMQLPDVNKRAVDMFGYVGTTKSHLGAFEWSNNVILGGDGRYMVHAPWLTDEEITELYQQKYPTATIPWSRKIGKVEDKSTESYSRQHRLPIPFDDVVSGVGRVGQNIVDAATLNMFQGGTEDKIAKARNNENFPYTTMAGQVLGFTAPAMAGNIALVGGAKALAGGATGLASRTPGITKLTRASSEAMHGARKFAQSNPIASKFWRAGSYGGRLGSLTGLGLLDHSAYNFFIEAQNDALKEGRTANIGDMALRGIGSYDLTKLENQLAAAALPIASLANRGINQLRHGIATPARVYEDKAAKYGRSVKQNWSDSTHQTVADLVRQSRPDETLNVGGWVPTERQPKTAEVEEIVQKQAAQQDEVRRSVRFNVTDDGALQVERPMKDGGTVYETLSSSRNPDDPDHFFGHSESEVGKVKDVGTKKPETRQEPDTITVTGGKVRLTPDTIRSSIDDYLAGKSSMRHVLDELKAYKKQNKAEIKDHVKAYKAWRKSLKTAIDGANKKIKSTSADESKDIVFAIKKHGYDVNNLRNQMIDADVEFWNMMAKRAADLRKLEGEVNKLASDAFKEQNDKIRQTYFNPDKTPWQPETKLEVHPVATLFRFIHDSMGSGESHKRLVQAETDMTTRLSTLLSADQMGIPAKDIEKAVKAASERFNAKTKSSTIDPTMNLARILEEEFTRLGHPNAAEYLRATVHGEVLANHAADAVAENYNAKTSKDLREWIERGMQDTLDVKDDSYIHHARNLADSSEQLSVFYENEIAGLDEHVRRVLDLDETLPQKTGEYDRVNEHVNKILEFFEGKSEIVEGNHEEVEIYAQQLGETIPQRDTEVVQIAQGRWEANNVLDVAARQKDMMREDYIRNFPYRSLHLFKQEITTKIDRLLQTQPNSPLIPLYIEEKKIVDDFFRGHFKDSKPRRAWEKLNEAYSDVQQALNYMGLDRHGKPRVQNGMLGGFGRDMIRSANNKPRQQQLAEEYRNATPRQKLAIETSIYEAVRSRLWDEIKLTGNTRSEDYIDQLNRAGEGVDGWDTVTIDSEALPKFYKLTEGIENSVYTVLGRKKGEKFFSRIRAGISYANWRQATMSRVGSNTVKNLAQKEEAGGRLVLAEHPIGHIIHGLSLFGKSIGRTVGAQDGHRYKYEPNNAQTRGKRAGVVDFLLGRPQGIDDLHYPPDEQWRVAEPAGLLPPARAINAELTEPEIDGLDFENHPMYADVNKRMKEGNFYPLDKISEDGKLATRLEKRGNLGGAVKKWRDLQHELELHEALATAGQKEVNAQDLYATRKMIEHVKLRLNTQTDNLINRVKEVKEGIDSGLHRNKWIDELKKVFTKPAEPDTDIVEHVKDAAITLAADGDLDRAQKMMEDYLTVKRMELYRTKADQYEANMSVEDEGPNFEDKYTDSLYEDLTEANEILFEIQRSKLNPKKKFDRVLDDKGQYIDIETRRATEKQAKADAAPEPQTIKLEDDETPLFGGKGDEIETHLEYLPEPERILDQAATELKETGHISGESLARIEKLRRLMDEQADQGDLLDFQDNQIIMREFKRLADEERFLKKQRQGFVPPPEFPKGEDLMSALQRVRATNNGLLSNYAEHYLRQWLASVKTDSNHAKVIRDALERSETRKNAIREKVRKETQGWSIERLRAEVAEINARDTQVHKNIDPKQSDETPGIGEQITSTDDAFREELMRRDPEAPVHDLYRHELDTTTKALEKLQGDNWKDLDDQELKWAMNQVFVHFLERVNRAYGSGRVIGLEDDVSWEYYQLAKKWEKIRAERHVSEKYDTWEETTEGLFGTQTDRHRKQTQPRKEFHQTLKQLFKKYDDEFNKGKGTKDHWRVQAHDHIMAEVEKTMVDKYGNRLKKPKHKPREKVTIDEIIETQSATKGTSPPPPPVSTKGKTIEQLIDEQQTGRAITDTPEDRVDPAQVETKSETTTEQPPQEHEETIETTIPDDWEHAEMDRMTENFAKFQKTMKKELNLLKYVRESRFEAQVSTEAKTDEDFIAYSDLVNEMNERFKSMGFPEGWDYRSTLNYKEKKLHDYIMEQAPAAEERVMKKLAGENAEKKPTPEPKKQVTVDDLKHLDKDEPIEEVTELSEDYIKETYPDYWRDVEEGKIKHDPSLDDFSLTLKDTTSRTERQLEEARKIDFTGSKPKSPAKTDTAPKQKPPAKPDTIEEIIEKQKEPAPAKPVEEKPVEEKPVEDEPVVVEEVLPGETEEGVRKTKEKNRAVLRAMRKYDEEFTLDERVEHARNRVEISKQSEKTLGRRTVHGETMTRQAKREHGELLKEQGKDDIELSNEDIRNRAYAEAVETTAETIRIHKGDVNKNIADYKRIFNKERKDPARDFETTLSWSQAFRRIQDDYDEEGWQQIKEAIHEVETKIENTWKRRSQAVKNDKDGMAEAILAEGHWDVEMYELGSEKIIAKAMDDLQADIAIKYGGSGQKFYDYLVNDAPREKIDKYALGVKNLLKTSRGKELQPGLIADEALDIIKKFANHDDILRAARNLKRRDVDNARAAESTGKTTYEIKTDSVRDKYKKKGQMRVPNNLSHKQRKNLIKKHEYAIRKALEDIARDYGATDKDIAIPDHVAKQYYDDFNSYLEEMDWLELNPMSKDRKDYSVLVNQAGYIFDKFKSDGVRNGRVGLHNTLYDQGAQVGDDVKTPTPPPSPPPPPAAPVVDKTADPPHPDSPEAKALKEKYPEKIYEVWKTEAQMDEEYLAHKKAVIRQETGKYPTSDGGVDEAYDRIIKKQKQKKAEEEAAEAEARKKERPLEKQPEEYQTWYKGQQERDADPQPVNNFEHLFKNYQDWQIEDHRESSYVGRIATGMPQNGGPRAVDMRSLLPYHLRPTAHRLVRQVMEGLNDPKSSEAFLRMQELMEAEDIARIQLDGETGVSIPPIADVIERGKEISKKFWAGEIDDLGEYHRQSFAEAERLSEERYLAEQAKWDAEDAAAEKSAENESIDEVIQRQAEQNNPSPPSNVPSPPAGPMTNLLGEEVKETGPRKARSKDGFAVDFFTGELTEANKYKRDVHGKKHIEQLNEDGLNLWADAMGLKNMIEPDEPKKADMATKSPWSTSKPIDDDMEPIKSGPLEQKPSGWVRKENQSIDDIIAEQKDKDHGKRLAKVEERNTLAHALAPPNKKPTKEQFEHAESIQARGAELTQDIKNYRSNENWETKDKKQLLELSQVVMKAMDWFEEIQDLRYKPTQETLTVVKNALQLQRDFGKALAIEKGVLMDLGEDAYIELVNDFRKISREITGTVGLDDQGSWKNRKHGTTDNPIVQQFRNKFIEQFEVSKVKIDSLKRRKNPTKRDRVESRLAEHEHRWGLATYGKWLHYRIKEGQLKESTIIGDEKEALEFFRANPSEKFIEQERLAMEKAQAELRPMVDTRTFDDTSQEKTFGIMEPVEVERAMKSYRDLFKRERIDEEKRMEKAKKALREGNNERSSDIFKGILRQKRVRGQLFDRRIKAGHLEESDLDATEAHEVDMWRQYEPVVQRQRFEDEMDNIEHAITYRAMADNYDGASEAASEQVRVLRRYGQIFDEMIKDGRLKESDLNNGERQALIEYRGG